MITLTPEQRGALPVWNEGQDVLITGPRVSGRTTALLHGALQLMGDLRFPSWRICYLVPTRQHAAWAQRTLAQHPALAQVRVRTPVQLAYRMDGLPRVPAWNSGPVNQLSRIKAEGERERMARSREGELSEEQQWASTVQNASAAMLEGRLPAYTETDRLLRTGTSYADPELGKEARQTLRTTSWLILVDDLHRFGPADLHLIAALRTQIAGEARARLLLTATNSARFQAWRPVLTREGTAQLRETNLTVRMNRREILDLLEAVPRSPEAEAPLVPARGFGGSVRWAPSLPPQSDSWIKLDQQLVQIITRASAAGHDLAIVTDLPLRREVRRLLDSGAARVARQQYPEVDQLLPAAFRLLCGLSDPGGGHPLAGGAFDDRIRLTQEERAQANEAWKVGAAIPRTSPLFGVTQDLLACRTAAEVGRVLSIRTAGLDDDPLRALAQVLAQAEQPRLYTGLLQDLIRPEYGPYTEVALVYQAGLPAGAFAALLALTLDHLHLIPVSRPADQRPPLETQVDPVKLLEQQVIPWDRASLTGTVTLERSSLLSLLREPGPGAYLRHHAHQHVSPEVFSHWYSLLGQAAPEEWQRLRRPGRAWHDRPTLQAEQALLRPQP